MYGTHYPADLGVGSRLGKMMEAVIDGLEKKIESNTKRFEIANSRFFRIEYYYQPRIK